MKNTVLRAKFEEIIDIMDNFAFEHEELEKRASTLEIKDHELRAREDKLNKDRFSMEEEKKHQKAEREAVIKQAVVNAKMKEDIEKSKNSLVKLGEFIKESEAQEKKAKFEMELLEIKKKELGDLQTLKEDLEKRERVLAKEKAIVHESNRILDIRRTKIKAREAQLQMESEIE